MITKVENYFINNWLQDILGSPGSIKKANTKRKERKKCCPFGSSVWLEGSMP